MRKWDLLPFKYLYFCSSSVLFFNRFEIASDVKGEFAYKQLRLEAADVEVADRGYISEVYFGRYTTRGLAAF